MEAWRLSAQSAPSTARVKGSGDTGGHYRAATRAQQKMLRVQSPRPRRPEPVPALDEGDRSIDERLGHCPATLGGGLGGIVSPVPPCRLSWGACALGAVETDLAAVRAPATAPRSTAIPGVS